MIAASNPLPAPARLLSRAWAAYCDAEPDGDGDGHSEERNVDVGAYTDDAYADPYDDAAAAAADVDVDDDPGVVVVARVEAANADRLTSAATDCADASEDAEAGSDEDEHAADGTVDVAKADDACAEAEAELLELVLTPKPSP